MGPEFRRVVKKRTLDIVKEMVRGYNPRAAFEGRYHVAVGEGRIKGCVSLARRSWYLTEVKHLFVREEFRGNGMGKYLVTKALGKIDTPLACCTVRADNSISLGLFRRRGFQVIREFKNPETGDQILFLVKSMD